MSNPEDSLYLSIGNFEEAATLLKNTNRSSYLMAAGLARLAEGLHAKLQKTDSRLAAIEAALRSQPSR
jgi:hypothetical protein